MKKTIILIIMLIALFGCELEPEYEWSNTVTDIDTDSIYPIYDEYISLLDKLAQLSIVDRSTINQELTILGITLSYTYSYYQSGDYSCYSFNWSYWSSYNYEFIYYIVIDIWTISNTLNRNMSSYYKG